MLMSMVFVLINRNVGSESDDDDYAVTETAMTVVWMLLSAIIELFLWTIKSRDVSVSWDKRYEIVGHVFAGKGGCSDQHYLLSSEQMNLKQPVWQRRLHSLSSGALKLVPNITTR